VEEDPCQQPFFNVKRCFSNYNNGTKEGHSTPQGINLGQHFLGILQDNQRLLVTQMTGMSLPTLKAGSDFLKWVADFWEDWLHWELITE